MFHQISLKMAVACFSEMFVNTTLHDVISQKDIIRIFTMYKILIFSII